MPNILMYASSWCPYCLRAKALFDKKKVNYQWISVDGQREVREQMTERTGRTSVPQIFIDDRHIGGCDELYALEKQGELDRLLFPASPSNSSN